MKLVWVRKTGRCSRAGHLRFSSASWCDRGGGVRSIGASRRKLVQQRLVIGDLQGVPEHWNCLTFFFLPEFSRRFE